MSDTAHDTHQGEHHAEAEPDSTNVALLGFIVAATAAVLVVTVWGLSVYFTRETEALRYSKVLSVGSAELDQLRTEERSYLEGYGLVDKEKGVYSIPIDQGMRIFVQEAQARARAGEPQRVGPYVPPPGTAPTSLPAGTLAPPAPASGAPAPATAPPATGKRPVPRFPAAPTPRGGKVR